MVMALSRTVSKSARGFFVSRSVYVPSSTSVNVIVPSLTSSALSQIGPFTMIASCAVRNGRQGQQGSATVHFQDPHVPGLDQHQCHVRSPQKPGGEGKANEQDG